MSDKLISQEVQIPGKVQLAGTLVTPEGYTAALPAVVLVTGSGEIDRDGTVAGMKLTLNLYKDLAEFISSLGFVTLRYDKRGVGRSQGEHLRTGFLDLVDDLDSCIEFIKSQPQVDTSRVVVLGHSEGAMISTVSAARVPVAGLVLLAGAAETLAEALARQRQLTAAELMEAKGFKGWLARRLQIDQKLEQQAQQVLDKMITSSEDVIKIQFRKFNAKWHREHFTRDVREDLKRVSCPVLAITGSRDMQANPACLKRVPELAPGESVCFEIKDMNHGLKEQTEFVPLSDIKRSLRAGLNQPLHPELRDKLSEWLLSRFHGVN